MIPNTFLSSDSKTNIHTHVWPVENPKAVLQIVHGMSEYIEKYDGLAKYLNSFGIYVVGHTHIGHYLTSPREDYGYFGKKDGWKFLIDDVEKMREIAKKEVPDVPYFILGHSMGSFILRGWTKKYEAKGADGVIYMGTTGYIPIIDIALPIINIHIFLSGSDRIKSKFINFLAFGSYFKKIKPIKTVHDWVSRDEKYIEEYRNDPNAGFSFKLGGFKDLILVQKYIKGMAWAKTVPKDLPILLMSGSDDPVGQYGKGVVEVAENLEKCGCTDVSVLLYEGMRHELYNEIGKEVVLEDLKDFILDNE